MCVLVLFVCVCVSSLTVTLEYYISIRLSFRSFRPVTEEADCFKISLWHVRCVQYIISAVTSWIAHFMLWMCQYYEVLSSDLMGSVSVDKLWPTHTHTHTMWYVGHSHSHHTHTHTSAIIVIILPVVYFDRALIHVSEHSHFMCSLKVSADWLITVESNT